ncbi:aldo/keto reductase [Ramlibacter albus]|uniref:Aldo/keto reductase n=1 Tax=Ramlibacter albus TaxID=2079448 RepID=A0A923MEQ7_9BURK|nr:aldo/keto reductase [Ramlibacter albus]MBC5767924.1 aldo/keto reductase [Ramlibacter albus]
MQTRRIGPFEVSCLGMGCMNLNHAYGVPPPPEQAEQVILAALDAGVTLFDTAALYGMGSNEPLVGRVLKPHRRNITLASKGGMAAVKGEDGVARRVIDGRPEAIVRDCENSLRSLQTDVIDVYYLHRWDKKVPIEESVGAISRLVEQGKVRAVGLSEVSAGTIRKAHKVHPIAAVQTEYSLWTRNPEIAVLDACKEIGAAFVAFSPLARGFLCDAVHDVTAFVPNDIRRAMPRFAPDHYTENLKLLPRYKAIAREAGCTPAQLALAWLLHKRADIVPIPGTSKVEHLTENMKAADVKLSPDTMAALEEHVNQRTVHGNRYSQQSRTEVDTEEF